MDSIRRYSIITSIIIIMEGFCVSERIITIIIYYNIYIIIQRKILIKKCDLVNGAGHSEPLCCYIHFVIVCLLWSVRVSVSSKERKSG